MEEADSLDRILYHGASISLGSNSRPPFAGIIQLKYLDSVYVPGATHASRKRLMIVGDVHGCKDERMLLILSLTHQTSNQL